MNHPAHDGRQTPPPPYKAVEPAPDLSNDPISPPPSWTPHRQEPRLPPDNITSSAAMRRAAETPTVASSPNSNLRGKKREIRTSTITGRERDRGNNSKSPMSIVKDAAKSYKDSKRAKEAAHKVNFYEKVYGFVPKNVMTEAEWRDARERAPKTKVPFKSKSSAILWGLG